MRRSLPVAFAAFLLTSTMFAGGILHNTNQSAMYTRMPARDATLGIDAVYYNPAGMTNAQAQAAFQGASAGFTQQSAETAAKGQLMNDQEVEAEKTGSGFTPNHKC